MPLFKECKIQSLQQPQNKFRKEAIQTDKQVEGRYSSGSRDLHKAGVILLGGMPLVMLSNIRLRQFR